jgi:hypothetical protein
MSRSRVEYFYGAGSDLFGKPSPGDSVTYHLHGGKLDVYYSRDHYVSIVETNSPYYRTRNGLRVGSRIPLGPCYRTRKNPCERRWNGFVLDKKLLAWTRNSFPGSTILFTERGRVTSILLSRF